MIKLYLKTVVVCSLAAGISLLLACIFEIYGLSLFIENIFLGLFCSLLVVIITSWLQFKTEQQRITKEITPQLKHIIDDIYFFKSIADYKPPLPMYEAEVFLDRVNKLRELDNKLSACWDLIYEQTYVSKRKNSCREKTLRHLLISRTPLMVMQNPDFIKKADEVISSLKIAVEAYISLADEGYYKDELKKWLNPEAQSNCNNDLIDNNRL